MTDVRIPWVFLCVSMVLALLTLNARAPVKRFWLLHLPGFLASWLTGELAAHHLFWQALGTALFVWAGALRAWPGWVGLGLTLLSWVGLVAILIESRRAQEVIERALEAALGPDYRARIDPDVGASLDEGFSRRQRLFPLPVYDRRVERTANVVYARNGGTNLRMDIYRRRDRPRDRPALLYIHGGAWIVGRKDYQGLPLMNRLAAHGWVCFSANYRLSPGATFPDHIVDVKSALLWIRRNAAEYGADAGFVAIAGGSAGGHLAALAALTPDERSWQPGFEDQELGVAACVPLYGVYDFTDRRGHWKRSLLVPMLERAVLKKRMADAFDDFDRASPMTRVRADAPPFFVIHGTHDVLVPIDDARHFVDLLRARSRAPVAYAELPGAQHAFEIFPSERTLHAVRGIEAFLAWVYSRYRAQGMLPP